MTTYREKAHQRKLVIIILLFLGILALILLTKSNDDTGTLDGADEIYPTVMVDGQLYEWRRGRAICEDYPDNSVYYGELIHADGEQPTKDCEFASTFSVTGQIYTVAGNEESVYLSLTTDWLNEAIVVFDLVMDD